MKIALLAPLYLPPTEFFHVMAGADMVVLDTDLCYNKRFKAMHRTVVESAHGPSFLTVPVSTPSTSRCKWNDVTISRHGMWWKVQKATMETLFGSTPFFSLYRQDIFPYLDEKAVGRPIVDLNIDLILAVRKLCSVSTPLSITLDPRYLHDEHVKIMDLRNQDFYRTAGNVTVLEHLFREGSL